MSEYFLAPDGQVVAVDADQAPALANAKGYLPATPEQIADAQATEKYGGTGQRVIAGVEGVARGLTARLSTAAERALGVPPEDIEGRMAAHPGTALGAEGLGVAGSVLAGVGVPAAIAKAGAMAGGRIAAGAVEGALYGVGNVVHEAALGDPNLTAQSALATVGLSAALGGGIGGLTGAVESRLGPAIGRAKAAMGDLAEGIATPEKLRGLTQEQHDAVEGALRVAHREIRPAEIAATLTTQPAVAQGELDRVAGRMAEVATNMRAQPELFPPMFAAKLEQIRDGLLRNGVEGLPPGEAFTALNDAKQTIDKHLGKWGRMISPEQQDAVAAIRGIRTELKSALEDQAIWGDTGARQAAFNEAQADYFAARDAFRKEFAIKRPGKGVNPDFTIDASKLARLSDTSNPRYPMRQEAWNDYQSSAKRLLGEIETSHVNAPAGSFDKDALEGLVNKTGEMEQAARQQGAVLRMLGHFGGAGPAMVGGALGGPAGAAVGMAVGRAAKMIPRAVDALSHLHANNEAVTAAIGAAAAKLASGSAKVARGEVAAGIAREFGLDAEGATARFEKHAESIRGHTADPERLREALEGMSTGLHEHAPQTAQALSVTAARAVAFLASKLPPTVQPGPLADVLPISQGQIAKYNRYREAIEHPAAVLRQAAAGTLTAEAVEALRAVYPQLYLQMQGAVIEKMHPDVPHRTKLMAAMLLGRDLDGTMNGPSILREQMRFVRPQGPKPTPSKAARLKGSDRNQTNAQRAAGSK